MNDAVELSVVIPAYLEEENLRILLPRIAVHIATLTPRHEIVVVDTFKPMDSTSEVCLQTGAVYVNRAGGNSFGCAIRTGIERARGKYVVFMDADGSHSPEFIGTLYAHREEFDVVIASRYIDGGVTENNKILVVMSAALNLTYRVVLGLKCKDISNSFKLYRGEQLKSLTLHCANFDIIEEILYKLNRRYRIKIKEVPAVFRKRMFGETKRNLFLFVFTYLFTLLKLRMSKD